MANWLLLRGLTREQRHWGRFPDTLSQKLGTKVLTLDAPGFGTEAGRRSPRTLAAITDDVRDRFGRLRGDAEWSILGISLGGMITLDWCARHPDDFARAVVINSSASNAASFRQRFNPRATLMVLGMPVRSPESIEREILAISSNRFAGDDDLVRSWASWRTEHRPSVASILAQVGAGVSFRMADAIDVPVLVLSSKGDRLVSYRCSEGIADRLGASIRTHDETAGHDLTLDDPDWVCDQVAAWITESTPG
jgi:pimeloyl-ACP methyl ester carboxylesterase